MTRDRLRHKIEDALARPIDRDLFESCAQDLLSDAYPTLVPIVGGDDAGLDGAVGTPAGPYPLVCTTGKDVIGNVTKNLREYLDRRDGPKMAVVATTDLLTGKRRRNIEDRGRELGVRIVNIHDRRYFTNRLYRNSRWRIDLLGIAGDVPALSSFPPRGRFFDNPSLIAREQELETLRGAGDYLLVGQPGSGKTFLHQMLAEEDACLFLTTDTRAAIADDIRDLQPPTIVVDDAHTKPELVAELFRMRAEMEEPFSIHANCWPGTESELRSILGIGDDRILRLDALGREEVVQIINACGIGGPDALLHRLLDQAEGKPGLAMVLSDACRRGEIERVWTGEFIADHLIGGRQVAPQERERSMLAAFAIGGDSGMKFSEVATVLGVPAIDLRETCAGLGAGGVLAVDDDYVIVRPTALQPYLVKEVFYGDGPRLDPAALIGLTPSIEETARVLALTRNLGGDVDIETIENLVIGTNDRDSWEYFGWADAACARTILGKHPDRIPIAAPGLLHHHPRETIARLLELSHQDQDAPEGAVDHPKSRIKHWMTGENPGHPSHIERRRLLLEEACKWADASTARDSETFGVTIGRTIAPEFEGGGTKPGSGRTLNLVHGVYPLEQLKQIGTLWDTIQHELNATPPKHWGPLIEQIEKWCMPARMERMSALPSESTSHLQAVGKRMLLDLCSHPKATRAVRTWAANTARWGSIFADIEVDPDFETLFGDRDRDLEFKEAMEQRKQELDAYAQRLLDLDEEQAFELLGGLEAEAREFGHTPAGYDRYVIYERLASESKDPLRWARRLADDGADGHHVHILLDATKDKSSDDYRAALAKLIDLLPYRLVAARGILALDPPDEELLRRARAAVKFQGRNEVHWLSHIPLPVETAKTLLGAEDAVTRSVTAVSEWIREPEGQIREGLEELWREGILSGSIEDDYDLKKILGADSELAFEWCRRRITSGWHDLWKSKEILSAASAGLTQAEKRQLILAFTPESFDDDIFDLLVGDDVDLFRDWLRDGHDDLKLRPLEREPSGRWIPFATVALDEGFGAGDLASHWFPRSTGLIQGPMSLHYEALLRSYEEILAHPDTRLHEAAQLGADYARRHLEGERAEEHHEAVHGLGKRPPRRRR